MRTVCSSLLASKLERYVKSGNGAKPVPFRYLDAEEYLMVIALNSFSYVLK